MTCSKIPNIANVDPSLPYDLYDPGHKYSIPYQWGSVALAVNTDKVTTPVTSYSDLWNPEFASRIVLLDDERQIIGMALLALGFDPNTTDAAELDAARAKLLELVPNIRLFDSDTPSTALLSGEADLGLIWNGEGLDRSCRGLPPSTTSTRPRAPSSGTTTSRSSRVPSTSTPRWPSSTTCFGRRSSLLITAEFPYSNPNKAALDLLHETDPEAYQTYMDFPATNPRPRPWPERTRCRCRGSDAIYDRIWTEFKTATGG